MWYFQLSTETVIFIEFLWLWLGYVLIYRWRCGIESRNVERNNLKRSDDDDDDDNNNNNNNSEKMLMWIREKYNEYLVTKICQRWRDAVLFGEMLDRGRPVWSKLRLNVHCTAFRILDLLCKYGQLKIPLRSIKQEGLQAPTSGAGWEKLNTVLRVSASCVLFSCPNPPIIFPQRKKKNCWTMSSLLAHLQPELPCLFLLIWGFL